MTVAARNRAGVVPLCGVMNERLTKIIDELERISESLNDASMALLSEAIEMRTGERPPLEKSVSQARRAVVRAIDHLRAGVERPDGGAHGPSGD